MIVYLHQRDTTGGPDPALAPYYGKVAPYHQRVPAKLIRHVYVHEKTTIPQVIAAVVKATGQVRSLHSLMINCHGEPGTVHLGHGLTVANAQSFKILAPYMASATSSIVVGCCYAAAGQQVPLTRQGCIREVSAADNGLSLLMLIARYTGARVIGALDEQITWELNGPVLTVKPDGRYEVGMGSTVDEIRHGQSGGSLVCRP
jgi:hypothetical protein